MFDQPGAPAPALHWPLQQSESPIQLPAPCPWGKQHLPFVQAGGQQQSEAWLQLEPLQQVFALQASPVQQSESWPHADPGPLQVQVPFWQLPLQQSEADWQAWPAGLHVQRPFRQLPPQQSLSN